MLIRFKNIDTRMDEIFRDLVFRFSHGTDPLLSQMKTYSLHEGDDNLVKSGDEVRLNDVFEGSAEYDIKAEDHATFSMRDFHEMARDMGMQLLKTKKKNLFETINRITQSTGNVLDNKGKPLDHDAFFNALEMIEIDFDEEGNPQIPTLVIHPDMTARVKQLEEERLADPEINRRYDDLIERKREAFRAREANRRLVG